jgi:CDP-diacylglycerol--serine O-phosphatidyltransferase
MANRLRRPQLPASRRLWHAVDYATTGPTMTKRHFSMLREFQLADWFTLGNAFCGTGAIFAAMRFLQEGVVGDLLWGMALIPLAFVFDALDGRIARWRKVASTLGRELDSLADVISFGVAPAALGYACGLQGGWDWVVLSYFVGCGVSRLARYNVTAESLSGEEGKVKFFEGTPIPTSVVIVGLLAVAAFGGRLGDGLWFGEYRLGPWLLHPLVLVYALSGSLMISKTLRIPKP